MDRITRVRAERQWRGCRERSLAVFAPAIGAWPPTGTRHEASCGLRERSPRKVWAIPGFSQRSGSAGELFGRTSPRTGRHGPSDVIRCTSVRIIRRRLESRRAAVRSMAQASRSR